MKECLSYEQVVRVATENAKAGEVVNLIGHIVEEDCESCRQEVRAQLEERLKILASDPVFKDCESFMERKNTYSTRLLNAINPKK